MPQMYPLNWIILFMMFMMTYLLFMTINYYNYNKILTINSNMMKYKSKIKSWKW